SFQNPHNSIDERHSVFISIGCSELIAKSPCEYDRAAKILLASSSARPDASSRYTRAARPTENASRITTRIRREEALGMGSFRPVVHNSLAGSPTASPSVVCTLAVSARPRELNPGLPVNHTGSEFPVRQAKAAGPGLVRRPIPTGGLIGLTLSLPFS